MANRLKGKTLGNAALDVRSRFSYLQHSIAPRIAAIVNRAQQFEVWATNLGLFRLGHSSLEYQLRDAPFFGEYTIRLLENLFRHLGHLSEILRLAPHPKEANSRAALRQRDACAGDDLVEGSDSSDDGEIQILLVESATATIDKLYRLAFRIHNPALGLGLSRALEYELIDPETGVNVVDQLRQRDQPHVEELFASYRSASPTNFQNHFLVLRLANANTRRRQHFGYWRKSKTKFTATTRPAVAGEPATVPSAQPRKPAEPNAPLRPIPASRPSTATYLDASKIELENDVSVNSSHSVVYSSQDDNSDPVQIPPPPRHLLNGEVFECPYCFTLCPRNMLEHGSWQYVSMHSVLA
ncbi:hypothetical protein BO99DRAFT_439481 [Aspergillus violaceofuscus CBS 115571]|uniref:Uncharacterized protein n=1 Tax=Aspergillus violaceofuscus (strain CBS 115571) TaxID=1450538 RepID=A0A2V5HNI9_ASPV1|nr:hypothetical protein BO99DRAFT_439481 [Aspergillus violaceofuscus CBS 115571]